MTAFALSALQASAQIKLAVNTKDGQTISGQHTFVVTAESKNLVTQVEFYVGEDLRDSDTSTPYEFKIDTLDEAEGDLSVRFVGYTAEGERAQISLKVKVDNGMSKGADYHVEKAAEAVRVGKWDEALTEGRIALKIKPGYKPARMVLARANFGKGVRDAAQKFAEDILAEDPSNREALDLLGAINLQQAFATINRGGDRAETLGVIRTAVKNAVTNRAKAIDADMGSPSALADDKRLAFAETAMRNLRFTLAIDALQPLYLRNTSDAKVVNRLAYAQLRAGRFRDAYQTLEAHFKTGKQDAVGYALRSIILSIRGDVEGSRASAREALLSDAESPAVKAAQAYLGLQGSGATAAKIGAALVQDNAAEPIFAYYASAGYYANGDFEQSRKQFEAAVLAEPLLYPMYVEKANQALGLAVNGGLSKDDQQYQYQVARAYLEAALAAKPESFEALTSLAIVGLFEGKAAEAAGNAQAAIRVAPEFAAAHYVLSAVFTLQQETVKADQESKLAGKLDPNNLEGRALPTPVDAWRYSYRYARTALLPGP